MKVMEQVLTNAGSQTLSLQSFGPSQVHEHGSSYTSTTQIQH